MVSAQVHPPTRERGNLLRRNLELHRRKSNRDGWLLSVANSAQNCAKLKIDDFKRHNSGIFRHKTFFYPITFFDETSYYIDYMLIARRKRANFDVPYLTFLLILWSQYCDVTGTIVAQKMGMGGFYSPIYTSACDVIGTIVAQKMGIGFRFSRWGTPKLSPTELL